MMLPERLWVPRRLFVSDEGEILTGPGAGLLVDAPALRPGTVGKAQRLRDLRHTIWLVERASIDDGIVASYAIVLPERLVDPDAQPHAHSWLEGLPLLAVSGLKWERIVREDRVRLHRVAVADDSEGAVLTVESAGGGRAPMIVRMTLAELERLELAGEGNRAGGGNPSPSAIVDRLLRVCSQGAFDEATVVAAWQVAQLLEPGYGYRGATDGEPATIEQVQHGLRPLEALFAAVGARAARQLEAVEAIRRELARPRLEGEPSPVIPVYGEVERTDEPECSLESAMRNEGSAAEGSGTTPFVLPAETRWFVGDTDRWRPEIPADLAKAFAVELRERLPPPQWLSVAFVVLLVLLVAVALALRH